MPEEISSIILGAGLILATVALVWATKNLARATQSLVLVEKTREEKSRIAELIEWGRRLAFKSNPQQVIDSLKKYDYSPANPEAPALRKVAILLREDEDSELLGRLRSITPLLDMAEAGRTPVIKTGDEESRLLSDFNFVISRLRSLLPNLESKLHTAQGEGS